MIKKDINSLIEQTLENIKSDREETEYFLENLKEYMRVSPERVADAGTTAAKFLETLQRSNEQLVKLANLVHKKDSFSRHQENPIGPINSVQSVPNDLALSLNAPMTPLTILFSTVSGVRLLTLIGHPPMKEKQNL